MAIFDISVDSEKKGRVFARVPATQELYEFFIDIKGKRLRAALVYYEQPVPRRRASDHLPHPLRRKTDVPPEPVTWRTGRRKPQPPIPEGMPQEVLKFVSDKIGKGALTDMALMAVWRKKIF